MRRIFLLWIAVSIIFLSVCPITYAQEAREYVGTTVVTDNLLLIDNNSILAARFPNQFVYIPVDMLAHYGFDVFLDDTSGKRIYTVTRNEENAIFPSSPLVSNCQDTNVYTTDAEVYIDSNIPANVFEIENGTVFVQSDELAKYGTYHWNEDTQIISINLENKNHLPVSQPFHNALGVERMEEIAYGTIVLGKDRCADIQKEDLESFLTVYWNFQCDRVIAPKVAMGEDTYYIKLWNQDRTKSYTVYDQGIMVGSFGAPCESHGEMKQNYVWYMPYVGNARNALYMARTTLFMKYLYPSYEEYVGNERSFTLLDENDIPTNNLLLLNGCSNWAQQELQKAAACNLMLYHLSYRYQQDITRQEFCQLIYRLIATEFSPNSDSRMGEWSAIECVIDERGLREKFDTIAYTDCDDDKIKFLSSAGIIQGIDDGTFAPHDRLTREQAATILYRTAKFLGNKTISQPDNKQYFEDENAVSDWAKHAVRSIYEMEIMKGESERWFSPQENYTVEQAIITMLRLYECK